MPVEDINAEQLIELIKSGRAEIIDVREPDEFKIIRLKNSKNIPMGELIGRLDEIDWSREVIFICRSGARSKVMSGLANGHGMNVKNLQFGIYECFKDEECDDIEILSGEIENYF